MIRQVTLTKIENGWLVADDGDLTEDGKLSPPRAFSSADANNAAKLALSLMKTAEKEETPRLFTPKIIQ